MFSEKLCRGFGISGFFNVQYLIDAATGAAHLLEINRRIVTHTHLGERVGADLPEALGEALDGRPPRRSVHAAAGAGDCVAIFPREWLRDPASPYLSTVPCDVPWDDPELLTAMVRIAEPGVTSLARQHRRSRRNHRTADVRPGRIVVPRSARSRTVRIQRSPVWSLAGPLDVAALARSLQLVVDRHDALRATLGVAEAVRTSAFATCCRLGLPVIDVRVDSTVTRGRGNASGRR